MLKIFGKKKKNIDYFLTLPFPLQYDEAETSAIMLTKIIEIKIAQGITYALKKTGLTAHNTIKIPTNISEAIPNACIDPFCCFALFVVHAMIRSRCIGVK